MTISKQEAMEQMSRLEAEMKTLREIIEKPERNAIIQLDNGAWELTSSKTTWGQLVPGDFDELTGYHRAHLDSALFESKEQAADFGAAIVTLCQLRRMPGTASPDDGGQDSWWTIRLDKRSPDQYVVFAGWWTNEGTIMSMISPAFKTKEDAEAAIEMIGTPRLIHMFKTLHGVK